MNGYLKYSVLSRCFVLSLRLYSVASCVLAVTVGHVLLNFGYIWASMIFESLSVATGLSFVFSICLLGSVGFFTFRLLRFSLVMIMIVNDDCMWLSIILEYSPFLYFSDPFRLCLYQPFGHCFPAPIRLCARFLLFGHNFGQWRCESLYPFLSY